MANLWDKLGLKKKPEAEQPEKDKARAIAFTTPKEPDRKALLREEATPSQASVRNVQHQYSSAGLKPQRLGQLMRDADEGNAQAWLEIAEQIEEKDGHIVGVFGQRKRAVTGLPITVEAASTSAQDQEIAQALRDWLDRDELRGDLFDIMDAVGKGYSVCEIIWNNSNPNLWTIDRIEWRDPRWFEFDRRDGRTLRLKGDGGQHLELTPNKFIFHQVKAKSGLPIRSGVMRVVAWLWLYKNFSIRDWVIFAEAYGQPLRLGKYGPGSSEEDRRVLLQAVSNLGSDAGAIIPDSMLIEFVKDANPTGSIDLFERLARYCDEQISKAVLGQTTTTDALAGGGLAGNVAHNEVRGDIADDDAAALSATLNRDLVRPFVTINFGYVAKFPRIRIRRPDAVDATLLSASAEKLVNMGARVSTKRMAEALNVPLADDNEEVLKPAIPAQPVMMSAQHRCGNPACADHGPVTMNASRRPADGIDQLADELAGEWEEMIGPIVTDIEQAIAASGSFEELENKLAEISSKPGGDKIVKRLQEVLFSSQLAGNLSFKL